MIEFTIILHNNSIHTKHTIHELNKCKFFYTVTEFLILKTLAVRPGHVKSRDQLMDAAYGDQIFVDDRTVDSHIKRLRKKFLMQNLQYFLTTLSVLNEYQDQLENNLDGQGQRKY